MNQKSQRHIVAFNAPYFAGVGIFENQQQTGDCVELIRRHDGKGYMVADLERDRDTMKLIKIHRLKTGLTLQRAKGLYETWRKEGEAKAKIKKAKPIHEIPTFPEPPWTAVKAGKADWMDIKRFRNQFLRRKWPRTFKAMDAKADAASIEKAYLLDCAEFSGIEAFPVDDSLTVKQLSAALYNHARRSKKTEAMQIDEAILFYWPRMVYFDRKQFAEEIKKLTGISVTPAQARQRRIRLGLTSRCPAGRRSF